MPQNAKPMTSKNLLSLAGKVALVTGASSGFGRHFARVLAGAGAKVALAARRIDALEQLAGEIRAGGGEAAAFAMDVTDRASVARAVADAEAALGPITILVNNAGVPSGAFFTKTSEEEWRSVMSVNLDGVFRVGQEVARRMVANGAGGSIVNIASLLGLSVIKGLSTYSTTKAAVISLTKSMALELARDRIRVNALAPGYFATEFNDAYLASEAGKRMMSRVPMARAGAVHELDGPLLLLVSDAGAFMTGSVVTVDGGHLLAMG
jgi:NAD(P)-dependent dehydrogenase (short-subunit alcohol dehydrogenase family)